MRPAVVLAIWLLSTAHLTAPAFGMAGTILSRERKNHATVVWEAPGVPAGQVGVLMEKNLVVGIFVTDPPDKKNTVEILDALSKGVVAKNRGLSLLEVHRPTAEADKASFLIWADEVGASLLVDGVRTGSVPAWLRLSLEMHDVVVELANGERPGAKIKPKQGGEYVLHLEGRRRPVTTDWNPYLLLDQGLFERKDEKPLEKTQWIDMKDGSRAYMGFPPVKHPVITHKVMPIYPPSLIDSHARGTVAVEAIVGTDGTIKDPRVIASSDDEFSQAAMGAVEQWVYQPATLDGRPVQVIFTVWVEFGIQ